MSAADAAAIPTDAVLEAAGARIGEIRITSSDIFDLSDPQENRVLYRLANRLHTRTRESAIRSQFLFRSGQLYSRQALDETERNLRQLSFLREPHIQPVAYHDGMVDIEVSSHDVWTLQIGPEFSRSGGANRSAFFLEDINLFGFGKKLNVGVRKTVDRTSTEIGWEDPNVLGTHWRDALEWTQYSDGHARWLEIGRPFYALDVHRSVGLVVADILTSEQRYQLGTVFDQYRHNQRYVDIYGGWSSGRVRERTLRLILGWRIEHDEFTAAPSRTQAPIPGNRRLDYPYVRLELISDQFQTVRNLDQIDRTEDLRFGLAGTLLAGWASPHFGADRSAVVATAAISDGWQLSTAQSLFVSGDLAGRIEQGRGVDLRTSANASWYWRTTERTLLTIQAKGSLGHALDLDHYYVLGGENGLRGYPLRYQLGTGRAVLKIEERLYTNRSLWRLFDIGAAAFFDVGRTWGANPTFTPQLGWLKDIGIGLRLGNSRSSFGNVIHVDLATPLDGVRLKNIQLIVGTEATF